MCWKTNAIWCIYILISVSRTLDCIENCVISVQRWNLIETNSLWVANFIAFEPVLHANCIRPIDVIDNPIFIDFRSTRLRDRCKLCQKILIYANHFFINYFILFVYLLFIFAKNSIYFIEKIKNNNNSKVLNNLFQLFQFDLGQLLFICILTICFYGFMVLVLLLLLFSFQKQSLISWVWLLYNLYALGTQSNYYKDSNWIFLMLFHCFCYFFRCIAG